MGISFASTCKLVAGFREFKTVSIHPVLQLIQCLLKMSLNDVNNLGTIAYEEVVHVKTVIKLKLSISILQVFGVLIMVLYLNVSH